MKYYTPSIEELYVGFECEHTTNMSAFKVDDDSRIYNSPLTIHELSDYTKWSLEENGLDKFVRVKYLDKEDIESLGFQFFAEKVDMLEEKILIYENKELNITFSHIPSSNLISIFTRDPSKCEYYYRFSETPFQVTNLRIKNKSELKKLLQQINTKTQ